MGENTTQQTSRTVRQSSYSVWCCIYSSVVLFNSARSPWQLHFCTLFHPKPKTEDIQREKICIWEYPIYRSSSTSILTWKIQNYYYSRSLYIGFQLVGEGGLFTQSQEQEKNHFNYLHSLNCKVDMNLQLNSKFLSVLKQQLSSQENNTKIMSPYTAWLFFLIQALPVLVQLQRKWQPNLTENGKDLKCFICT